MTLRVVLAKLGALLMSVWLAAPCTTLAQQTAYVPRVGFLSPQTAQDTVAWLTAFRAGLRDLGYVEGKDFVVEYRWAENKYDRLSALAEELTRLKVDVLVTYTTPGTLAAKRATSTIPIVMATSSDAVSTGIVASLARPGGNVTGSTFMGPELFAKQLELLTVAVPGLKRVARIVNPTNASVATIFKESERVAESLKIEQSFVQASKPSDFEGAFAAAVAGGAEAIALGSDPILIANSKTIAGIARKQRLPSIGRAQYADAGGMIGFGPDPLESWQRAAYFVDRILKGAKPAELPIEQPTKFELVINVDTAKALGIALPPSLLLRANRVVE